MTPTGERGFRSAEVAEEMARKRGIKSFAVIRNSSRPFMPPEFAWLSPVEFYMSRAVPATLAGIMIVKTVTE